MARKAAGAVAVADDSPFDFHLSGQTFNRIERMLEFWSGYPDRDGLKAYLYRVSNPVIDARQTGVRESSLQKWENDSGVPSAEKLLREWGSSKYQLLLNDNKKPEGVQQVARCTFTLDDPDIPAVYDPRQLVVVGEGGEKNRPYIERWLSQGWTIVPGQKNAAYVDRRTKEQVPFSCLLPPGSAAPGGDSVDSKTLEKLIDKAGSAPSNELTTALLNLLTSERKGQSDPVTTALQIMDRIKPQSDPLTLEVLKLVSSMQRPAAPASAEPLEATRSTLGFLRELRESGLIGDAGGASAGNFWPAAFQALPAVLDFLGKGFTAAMMAKAAAGGAAAAPGAVEDRPVQNAGGAELLPATSAPAAAAAVVGEKDEMLGKLLGLPEGCNISLPQLIDAGQDALHAFQNDIDGESFAHGLCCRRGGVELYNGLAGCGKESLLQLLSMAAPMAGEEIAAEFKAHPEKFSAFLDSFLKYGGSDDSAAPAV